MTTPRHYDNSLLWHDVPLHRAYLRPLRGPWPFARAILAAALPSAAFITGMLVGAGVLHYATGALVLGACCAGTAMLTMRKLPPHWR